MAGTAALMLSANPALTPAQVRSLLQSSVRAFPTQPPGSTVPVCQAPTTTAQNECYCTTSTCGAGMLDAGAAVAAVTRANLLTASLTPSAYTVLPGTPVRFDSKGSAATSPATITAYQWTIADGQGLASFSSATNAATATAVASGGTGFTVRLTVTDSLGQQASSLQAVDVTAPAPTATVSASASTVTVGDTVTFDGSASTAASGRTIASYRWALASGSAFAALSGSTTGSTATVKTSAAGSFTVALTVTDSAGVQGSASATVTVSSPPPPASTGGGGGGAMSPLWVLGVAAASAALAATRRRGGPASAMRRRSRPTLFGRAQDAFRAWRRRA